MKKVLLLFAFFSLSISLVAQSTVQLDEKAGFKNFKLEDPYSKWKDSTTLYKRTNDSTAVYWYLGKCCNSVFEYPVDNVLLVFCKDKMIAIIITLEKFQKEYKVSQEYTKFDPSKHEAIKSKFNVLYGPPTSFGSDASENPYYSWQGKKVLLTAKYEYLGVENGDHETITIMSVKFLTSSISSGF